SVLVTGGGRGLGLAIALRLAERGFRVWATVRDRNLASRLAEIAALRRVHVAAVVLDVTDPESIDRAIDHVAREGRGLYGVVHNAGTIVRGYFEDLSDEEIRRVVEVNLFGVVNVTRRALPIMRRA